VDLVEVPAKARPVRHPWETARASFFLRLLREEGALTPALTVLDVGAGDAWFATRLIASTPGARVVCYDPAYLGAPPAPVSPALQHVTTLPPSRFGLVLLLDVLEHVEDDAAFLRSVVDGRLTQGASVLVSVPAWPGLFGDHDRRLRHHRRYAPRSARSLIEGAGLQIHRQGGLFHSLLLPRLLSLANEMLSFSPTSPAHAGEWHHGPALTSAASALMAVDNAVSRLSSKAGLPLPGLSWWALCRESS
jgi:hypothetical protein